MPAPRLELQPQSVRDAFTAIMSVFEVVSGGHPAQKHQEAILATLKQLDERAFTEGYDVHRRTLGQRP